MTANDKYLLLQCVNLLSPIQMELYLKQTIFLDFFFFFFFFSFLESTSNFEHFKKKDDSHTYFSAERKDCERVG